MAKTNLFNPYQIRPIKKLGQNFLIDKKVLEKILNAANLSSKDTVLEIGPGLGVLTFALAKKVKKVIAVEKDKTLCDILKENIKKQKIKNIEIIQGDILKTAIYDFGNRKNYKMVANIPYYLTSPLIRKFLESDNPPQEMVLMLQKEVAQRICAKPPKMSLLAVSVQFYSQAEIIAYVSKKSFWPEPKVDSAIVKITPKTGNFPLSQRGIKGDLEKNIQIHTNPPFTKKEVKSFFQIVRAGFSHPRKQLINNLSQGLKISREQAQNLLLKAGVNPQQRAETLTVDNWQKLNRLFIQNMVK